MQEQYKACPQCGQPAHLDAGFCSKCGHQYTTRFAHPNQPVQTQAFYAVKPQYLQEAASKKLAAGICGIFLNCLGIHKFILGYPTAGLVMLLGSILSCGFASPVFGIIGFIEGVMYLTKSDDEFYARYIANRQEWF